MNCTNIQLAVFGLLVGVTASAYAQTISGPAIGSPIQPLKVAAITGDGAGDDLDFAARRKGQSTVFAFVQADKWDRPIARFLSTLDKELKGKAGATRDGAAAVGKTIAERAKKAGVSKVVFDRGAFLFHGRVKALADAAREGGLEF